MTKSNKIGLALLGFLSGFASASLGIGGGVILIPVLVLFFKEDIKEVIGTSLAAIIPSVLVGTISHYFLEGDNIKFKMVLFLVTGAVAGSRIGIVISKKISSVLLNKLFAFLMIVASLKMLGVIDPSGRTFVVPGDIFIYTLLVVGFLAGIASALFGIGGGIVIVPALSIFFGLGMHQAIATSLAAIFPIVAIGTIFHKKLTKIKMDFLKYLIPLALIGAVGGAFFSTNLPDKVLRDIFGIFVIICSMKLFFYKSYREKEVA